jgi:hypothetical protein
LVPIPPSRSHVATRRAFTNPFRERPRRND